MELEWNSRGKVTVTIDGRIVVIPGELLLEHNPDFLIYAKYLSSWQDGAPSASEEKEQLLAEVVAEAAARGWIFEIEY